MSAIWAAVCRVADIHAAYVAKVPGFAVLGQAHTAAEAYEFVRSHPPELLLLDLYLPDEHGLGLMQRLRDLPEPHPDVIEITAARDVDSIRAAMQLGAVHYVVKPFGFARLAIRLDGYRELRAGLTSMSQACQDDVDKPYGLLRRPAEPKLPKGQSLPTMTRILDTVRAAST